MKSLFTSLFVLAFFMIGNTQPSMCLSDAINQIVANGGLYVAEEFEFVASGTNVFSITPNSDGVINLSIEINGITQGTAGQVVNSDNVEIIGLSLGDDNILVISGTGCAGTPSAQTININSCPITYQNTPYQGNNTYSCPISPADAIDILHHDSMYVGSSFTFTSTASGDITLGDLGDGIDFSFEKNGGSPTSSVMIGPSDVIKVNALDISGDDMILSGGGTTPVYTKLLNPLPSMCLSDALTQINANGGLDVGEEFEFVASGNNGFFMTDGGDGSFNLVIEEDGVDQGSSGSIISGNNIVIRGISNGVDFVQAFTGTNCSGNGSPVQIQVGTMLPITYAAPPRVIKFQEKHQIQFTTAIEVNNEKFIIEHSVDGRTFLPIGYISGAGHSTSPISYEYIHNAPSYGMNYYRIKQVDFDGRYEYSDVISAQYDSRELAIYPNPVGNVLHIVLPNGRDATLQIIDGMGRVVKDELATGKVMINMTNMDAGLYVVRCGDVVRRIIKL